MTHERAASRQGRRGGCAAALFAIGLGLLTASAHADGRIYEWRDGNGTPTFGDAPPSASVKVRLRQGVSPGGARPDTVAPPDDAAIEACDRKRSQVDSYRRASALTETNALGETREYSTAERERLIERAEAEARVLCGDAP